MDASAAAWLATLMADRTRVWLVPGEIAVLTAAGAAAFERLSALQQTLDWAVFAAQPWR